LVSSDLPYNEEATLHPTAAPRPPLALLKFADQNHTHPLGLYEWTFWVGRCGDLTANSGASKSTAGFDVPLAHVSP